MTRLLDCGLLHYSQISDLAEGMLSSVDVNGPVDAVDATIGFWVVIAAFRARDNLGSAYDTVERVLRWLFMRWSPSKLRVDLCRLIFDEEGQGHCLIAIMSLKTPRCAPQAVSHICYLSV